MNNITNTFESINVNSIGIGFVIGINFCFLAYVYTNKYFNFAIGCIIFINSYFNLILKFITIIISTIFNISYFFTFLLIFTSNEILKDISNYLKKKESLSILIDNLKSTIMLSFLKTFVVTLIFIIFDLVIIKKLLLQLMNIMIKLNKIIHNFLSSSLDEAFDIFVKIFSIKN